MYGGIVGSEVSGDIQKSYAAGTVTSSTQTGYVGGIAGVIKDDGDAPANIESNFSALTQQTLLSSGGVAGGVENDDPTIFTVTNTYFDTDQIGTSDCDFDQVIANCYPISGQPNYFKNNATNPPLNSWDFTSIWQTSNSYPIFKVSLVNSITPIPTERLNGKGTGAPAAQSSSGGSSPATTPTAQNDSPTSVTPGGGTSNSAAPPSQSFLEKIAENIKDFVRKLPEGVVRSFPFVLFGLALMGVALILLETRRQGRHLRALNALIAKQRSIAQQRDTFWHLAANYLRAPVTLLMGGSELLELKAQKTARQNAVIRLVKSLQTKVSVIMQNIEESDTLKGIQWPKEQPLRSVTATLSFWAPLIAVAILVVLANYVAVNFRKFDVSTITYLTQAMVFAVVGYALYIGLRSLRSTKRKVRQAESMAAQQGTALREARTTLVHDSVASLGSDVTDLQQEVDNFIDNDDTKPLFSEGATRLHQMITSFELLSAAETGHLSELAPSGSRVNLASILRKVIKREDSIIQDKKLTVDAPELPKIEIPGNARLAEQVVGTVLDNAIAFSPDNATVNVELLSGAGMQGLAIHDAGPGVSKDQLSHMFEPFTKADGDNGLKVDHEGLGIDLYLNKLIMKHLGGDISANSLPGQGTTIKMWWPVSGQ